MSTGTTLFTARWLVVDTATVLENAGLLVREGRVLEVVAARTRARRRARRHIELGDLALVPGLVNAHAHLELTGLAGRVPAGRGFVDWVRELVPAWRAEAASALVAAARLGADRLLASGCTAVGDIDSTGAGGRVLAHHPLRSVVYREVLDLHDAARRRAALAALDRAPRSSRRFVAGISPHAPYSVSAELLAAAGLRASRRKLRVAVHWAETREEGDWLEAGEGSSGEFYARTPPQPGLDRLEGAGLLGRSSTLVHGNDPRRDALARIAAAGASVVHCPGSHAFFARPPFPLMAYRAAGVPLALGTDSQASNEQLDMRREMALVRAAFPALDPREVWSWATEGGARALGWGGRIGALRPGMQADMSACSTSARRPADLWDTLTAGLPDVRGVWIGGKSAVTTLTPSGTPVQDAPRARAR